MKMRTKTSFHLANVSTSALVSAAAALFVYTGSAVAGGDGHGCAYSGQLASIAEREPVLADATDVEAIDPELLLLLKQQEAEANGDLPVIHN